MKKRIQNTDPLSGIPVIASLLGLILLTYSFIYVIFYLRSNSIELAHELAELKATLNYSFAENAIEYSKLKQELIEANAKLLYRRHYERELLQEVLPWERCLRFHLRTDCVPGLPVNDDEPPCILDVLQEMLFDTVSALEQSNITYFINYGTLLGAVRDQKIIPWTTDIDIVIHTNIWKRIGKKLYDSTLLDEKGYRWFHDRKYTDMARLCIGDDNEKYAKWTKEEIEPENYWDSGYPYVDFYQGVELKGWNYTVLAGPPCTFKTEQIFPLMKIPIGGRLVNAPRDPRPMLAQIYGPSWMRPPTAEERDAHGDYYTACAHG